VGNAAMAQEGVRVDLIVLSVPGCLGAALLDERLAAALAERPGVTVTRQVIADEDQAAESGMHGSPTLLVDGVDPFAAPGLPTSMSCRLYRCRDGRAQGSPSVEQLIEILQDAGQA